MTIKGTYNQDSEIGYFLFELIPYNGDRMDIEAEGVEEEVQNSKGEKNMDMFNRSSNGGDDKEKNIEDPFAGNMIDF